MEKEITKKLEKFEKYLRRKNFTGATFYLKKNILDYFKEVFKEELKK